MIRPFTSAFTWAIRLGRDDELTKERAAYAEIGRIVGIPFSVANVYERFADQVAKIISFDLITITHLDMERETIKIMYGIGLDAMGFAEGDTLPFKDSVVSEVTRAKRAIRTDEHEYIGSSAQSLNNSGLPSRIATPLIANDKVVGTLHLASGSPNAYGESELARLEIVGNQIAGAIASAILLQAERDRSSQLETLYEVAATIAQPLTFATKAQRIVDALASVASADHVALRREARDHKTLELVASAGLGTIKFKQSLSITDVNPVTHDSYLTGEPINFDDYSLDPSAQPDLVSKGVRSLFFLPVRSGDRTLGSLSVASNTPNRFDDDRIAIIKAFSHEIWSLLNSVEQAEKLQESQETALESERRQTRIHDGLYRISRIFAEAGDFKSKATAALEIVINLAGADWATLRVTKESEPGFHLAAAAGLATAKIVPAPVVTEADGEKNNAFSGGCLTVVDDYAAWPGASRDLIDAGMQSLVILPIMSNEKSQGAVTVISKRKDVFNQELVELLASVVDGLGNLFEISTLQDASQSAHQELERLTEELFLSNIQLEDRVTARTQELEAARQLTMRGEKLATIGQLSAGMAHDLRNPLGAIRNASYLLKRELAASGAIESNPKLDKFIEIIENQVIRSNESITGLMDFAKIKQVTLVETDLGEVLKQSIETMSKHDGITVSLDIDPYIRPVVADGEQLQRVFLNLANNSQEAMVDGGCLTITASCVDGNVEITFSDTGGGIAEDDLDKIFDPLFTTKIKGTGLGLAVCLEIVEGHGGTISARRRLNASGGTTFDVKIPVHHSI